MKKFFYKDISITILLKFCFAFYVSTLSNYISKLLFSNKKIWVKIIENLNKKDYININTWNVLEQNPEIEAFDDFSPSFILKYYISFKSYCLYII